MGDFLSAQRIATTTNTEGTAPTPTKEDGGTVHATPQISMVITDQITMARLVRVAAVPLASITTIGGARANIGTTSHSKSRGSCSANKKVDMIFFGICLQGCLLPVFSLMIIQSYGGQYCNALKMFIIIFFLFY